MNLPIATIRWCFWIFIFACVAMPNACGQIIVDRSRPAAMATSGRSDARPDGGSNLTATSISLVLCVDPPDSGFPCGSPLQNTPIYPQIAMYFGQLLDGASNLSSAGGSVNSTGTVTFYFGSSIFCVLPVSGGTCPVTAGYLFAGSGPVVAVYSGDSNYAGSTSNSIPVNVSPDITSSSLSSSMTPAPESTPVTFTATLAGNFAVPTGAVEFLDGNAPIGKGTLNATGQASFTTSTLAVGTHSITAVYGGTQNFLPVTSAALSQVIKAPNAIPPTPADFTLTVTPSPIFVAAGQTAILKVTVQEASGFAEPVTLSCASLPGEASCSFVAQTIPAGGGSTTLDLATAAPHACGSPPNDPYGSAKVDVPSCRQPATRAAKRAGGLLRVLEFGGPMAAGLLLLWPVRRRSRRRGLLVAMAMLAGLAAISGCGACTDLGTYPDTYSITVTGKASGAASQSATVVLKVLPG